MAQPYCLSREQFPTLRHGAHTTCNVGYLPIPHPWATVGTHNHMHEERDTYIELKILIIKQPIGTVGCQEIDGDGQVE